MQPPARNRPRPTWAELPASVRDGVEAVLGSSVAAAASVGTGLTPGVASRLLLADGRRVFLKAAGVARGAEEVAKLRREAAVAAALPAGAPAPGLIGVHDEERWVAVVFADVPGRPPALPWRPAELTATVAAVRALAGLATPSPVKVPAFSAEWAGDLVGWRELAARRPALPAGLDPWAAANLDLLASLEADWPAAATGTSLLHGDLRADNVLIADPGPRAVLVDWASACVGARWLDLAFLLPGVAAAGGPEPEWVVAGEPLLSGVEPAAVTVMVAAVAGFFVTVSAEPPPWHAPTVRAGQAAAGAAALQWLRHRLSRRLDT